MNAQSVSETGIVKLSRQQFSGTIISLQIILLLAALDQTIITTAMPRIVADLGGFERYASATTAYLFASTIAVPVFARLSDRYGRKPLLLAGINIFIAASVLCGCAGLLPVGDGMTQLILSRALQGLGGGILLALVFTVVADILSPSDRGRYQGHFAAVFALASIFGPVLGGWVAEQLSWRWLFFINVPVGALGMYIFAKSFPLIKSKQMLAQRLDKAGIALFIILFITLLFGLGQIAGKGITDLMSLAAVATFIIVLWLFICTERKAEQPLMPLRLFVRPIIAIASISLFVTGIGMFGSVLLVPLFLQSIMAVSPAASGALLTPLILTVAGASVVGGMTISRTKKYKNLILIALALMTAGTFCLSRIDAGSSMSTIITYMIISGIGMGLVLPIYPIVVQNAVSQAEVGAVTGFSTFFRSIGGTVGVAAFGAMMLASYRNQLVSPLLTGPVLSAVENPLQPAKLHAQLRLLLGNARDVETVSEMVKHALVNSIDSVFAIYAGALFITLLLTICLDELPLRSEESSGARLETP